MSNDYTLPPLPDTSFEGRGRMLAYGHACAEHARAPLVEENARLLARVAELEAENQTLTRECSDAEDESGRLEEELQKEHDENDRLRAEVEALRADAERYAHLKSIAKVGITKRQEFVITLDLVPCPAHISMLDLALDADRHYYNKEPTPE